MDMHEEPNEFYGVPLEEFVSPYLLSQLDKEDIPYLRTIVMCKLYDAQEDLIDQHSQQVRVMLDGFRGTSRESQRSAPK